MRWYCWFFWALVNIATVASIAAIAIYTDGWWKLLALLPLTALQTIKAENNG